MSCRIGLRSRPSNGAGDSRANGLEVASMNSRKAAPISPCTASTLAAQRRRQVAAEQRHQRAEEGQDQHPEQHRAFVVAPGAGDLVEHRLQRVGVLPDIGDREIRLQHRPIVSAAKASADKREAGHGDRPADGHQPLVAGARADQRHGRLHQRQREGQHQREMAESRRSRRSPLSLLPDALGLQAVGDFLRHVGLVVLGQHAVGDEHAVRPRSCLR